ncbi:MAG: carbonic anhydrase [Patescibacteria group bacterium]
MKTKFSYNSIHHCEAVVLTCIDFRFWRETLEFIEEDLGIKTFDFPSLPGSAKAINECLTDTDLAMRCIGVPCELHEAKKIVIVNHEDCGAYGGSSKFGTREEEQAFHEEELKKAKEKILAKYPNREVVLVYAKLTDNKENIEFVKIG